MSDDFVYDITNEFLIIGAAIADRDIREKLVRQLSSDEFFDPKHPPIFSMLRNMTDQALEYEFETAIRLLANETDDDSITARLKLIEENAKVPENLEWSIETLKWDAQRATTYRNLVPKLIKVLKDPKAESTDVQSVVKSILRSTQSVSGIKHLHKPSELQRKYTAEIEQRRLEKKAYPLGWEPFDDNLSEGFMPRRTSVVVGLPGSGKSTVCSAWALKLALQEKRRVLFCAWEMEPSSIIDVMCAHLTGIGLTQIIRGDLNSDQTKSIHAASQTVIENIQFMGFPFIDDLRAGNKPSNDRNLQILEYHIAESGADVVFYDLWERMLRQKDVSEVEIALHWMQDIHKEYNCHGVIVHQLRLKDIEKRQDKRPTREGIKGTGAYVEVPDMIYGIHRPAQFKNVTDSSIETICMKQRKGRENWAIQWDWCGANCGFSNPREVPYDPGLESAIENGDIGDIKETARGGGKWE